MKLIEAIAVSVVTVVAYRYLQKSTTNSNTEEILATVNRMEGTINDIATRAGITPDPAPVGPDEPTED